MKGTTDRVAVSLTATVLVSSVYTKTYKWGWSDDPLRRPVLWFKTRKALKQYANHLRMRFCVITEVEWL